jgi:hypothetical protein
MDDNHDSAHIQGREGRAIIGMSITAFAFLFAAALILWVGYGQSIFVDLVTFVRSCF